MRSPLHITCWQLQDHKHVPVTAAELFGPYIPLCCCSQGGSPAPRLRAGTSCNSSCAKELQQGCGCRLAGFALAFWGLSKASPSSGGVAAATSSAMGRHLCSPAFSAVLSVLCLGLGNDMQALFLLKNFAAPEMFIKVDISKGKQVLEVMEKERMPAFSSSAPRQACYLSCGCLPK